MRRDWNCGPDAERVVERENSEDVLKLSAERGDGVGLRADGMREDESGGVGGACVEQAVDEVGGVAGVSRGERGKTDAREGERAGES